MVYCHVGLHVLAGLENNIVEFNECRDMSETFLLRLRDGDVRHNLIAWNKVVQHRLIDLRMGIVFDGSRAGGNAQVFRAQSIRLLRRDNTYRGDPSERWLVITRGKARCTICHILDGSADELRLDIPLPVMPKKDARAYISPLFLQNLVADNWTS